MMGAVSTPVPPERMLAFHPIVLGDQVIVCDGSQVVAFNLNDRPADPDETGAQPIKHAWRYPAENGTHSPQATRNSPGIPRYTLTAIGHKIYARMGTMALPFPGMGGMGGRTRFHLDYCPRLEQGRDKDLGAGVVEAGTSQPSGGSQQLPPMNSVSFEGTPVGDARNVYVAVTDRREHTATYIACFDAKTGDIRWIRYVGSGSTGQQQSTRHGHGHGHGYGWSIREAKNQATITIGCFRLMGRLFITKPTWVPWWH